MASSATPSNSGTVQSARHHGSFSLAGSGSGGLMTTAPQRRRAPPYRQRHRARRQGADHGGRAEVRSCRLSAPPPGCAPFGQVAQNTAEIYNPAADSFTATGSMPGCPAGIGFPPTCTTGTAFDLRWTHSAITTAGRKWHDGNYHQHSESDRVAGW